MNLIKLEYDLYCKKVTHIGRVWAVQQGMDFGSSVTGMKAQGNWSIGDVFHKNYHHGFPVDAMLALAGFNGERKDEYFVPRDYLGEASLTDGSFNTNDTQILLIT